MAVYVLSVGTVSLLGCAPPIDSIMASTSGPGLTRQNVLPEAQVDVVEDVAIRAHVVVALGSQAQRAALVLQGQEDTAVSCQLYPCSGLNQRLEAWAGRL